MKNKKLISFLIFIICLIFVLSFESVILKAIKEDYKRIDKITYNQNIEFEHRAEIQTSKNGYFVLDQSKLLLYSHSGAPIWEKSISSRNVIMQIGSEKLLLAEKKSGDIFIIDFKGNIEASYFGLGPVINVKLFDDSYVGALKQDGSLTILDNKLEIISTTQLPKGEIIDFSINVERQDIVALILDLSRKDFNTKLVIATFNGKIISGSNLFSEIAYSLWLTDEEIFIITDSKWLKYDFDCNLVSSLELDRTIRRIHFDENSKRFYLNIINEASQIDNPKSENSIMVISNKGEAIGEFDAVLEEIRGITRVGNRLMAYNSREVVFFDNDGKKLDSYRGKDEIIGVNFNVENYFGISYISHMDLYEKR